MKPKVYTSLSLPQELKNKLEHSARVLRVDTAQLLSVLCSKAGKFVFKEGRCLQTVEYQERGQNCEIMPVCFFAEDHEFMHAQRYACKVSVSKLLACAIVMFLDEIMEKGIYEMEIEHFREIQDSYKNKTYMFRNLAMQINENDQLKECTLRIIMEKT